MTKKPFKKVALMGCALALTAIPTTVIAQDTTVTPPAATVPAAPQQPVDPAEFQQAIRLLSIMNAAFSNTNVNEVTKAKLFDCMFYNSLQQLNSGVQTTFKDNPELSFDNNVHLFRVATAICGVTAEELAKPPANASANPPAPAQPQAETPGR